MRFGVAATPLTQSRFRQTVRYLPRGASPRPGVVWTSTGVGEEPPVRLLVIVKTGWSAFPSEPTKVMVMAVGSGPPVAFTFADPRMRRSAAWTLAAVSLKARF